MGAAVGMNRTSGLKQAGRNRDNICYPEDDCSHLVGGAPDGYRWYYDLLADDGTAFDVSIGHAFGAFRLELAFTQRANDVKQEFTGITYWGGEPIIPRPESEVNVHQSFVYAMSMN